MSSRRNCRRSGTDAIRALEALSAAGSAIEPAQRPWKLPRSPSRYWTRRRVCRLEGERGGAVPSARQSRARRRSSTARLLRRRRRGSFDIDDRFTLSAWVYSDPRRTAASSPGCGHAQGQGLRRPAEQRQGPRPPHQQLCRRRDPRRDRRDDPPKRWHHITVTYDGSRMAEGVQVYIDGKPAKSKVLQRHALSPVPQCRQDSKSRCASARARAREALRGLIDGVRIYGARARRRGDRRAGAGRIDQCALRASRRPQRSRAEKAALRWYFLENAAPPEIRDAWKR